ncbi:MAG: trypsin-like peptidase domain-containing protein [Acidobacteriota bacterium]
MLRRLAVLTIFLCAGFAGGLVLTGRLRSAETAAAADPRQAEVHPTGRAPVAITGGMPDLTGVAQRAIASVTNISSTQIVRTTNSPFSNDPFFRQFFGDQNDPFGYRERRAQSLGSGVIVSADGYVLTNNHVVGDDPRAQVSVTMPDKRELKARIIGVDSATDIAVLKIEGGNLPTLPWGDSSKLKIAEWVLAIGNPFQLDHTVTLGIVSATGRSLEGRLASYEDFIQTDAAINPGNSGGALVSARGELIGINTAIFSETGGYQGIGFAVPSNLARHVMDDLIKFGEVQRGTIPGITLQALTSETAQQLRAPDTHGVLVYQMERGSEAYQVGLRPGDVIVSFNGTTLDDSQQFVRLLADAKIGSTITLGLVRDGKPLTVKVTSVKSTGRSRRPAVQQ